MRSEGSVLNLGGTNAVGSLKKTHELSRVVDEDGQMLRTYVDRLPLVLQRRQRHYVGVALAEKAEREKRGHPERPGSGSSPHF